jgi:phospholipase A1/A2
MLRTQAFSFFLPLVFALCGLPNPSWATAPVEESQLVRLQQHKPIYAIAGRPDTKIQLSFKVQIMKELGLHFGYTQLMMWDVLKPSAPIRDINYNPDLFYRIVFEESSPQWLDVGLFEHESNGRDGTASRSWNRAYMRYHSATTLDEQTQLVWSIKGWLPYGYNDSNADILRYRGLWELQCGVTNFLGPFFGMNELALRIYPGGASSTNPLQGGQELTLRAKTNYRALAPTLVFQLFHGYGENMLDYRANRFGLRAGFGF